jgi:hypothetical protein
MNTYTRLCWLSIFLLSAALTARAQESKTPPPPPPKYRMELVYIFESHQTEFIFVIGNAGFKSVASLKRHLSGLPPGAILEWAPGCMRLGGEPLLSSEPEMESFKAFCLERNINFVLIPTG